VKLASIRRPVPTTLVFGRGANHLNLRYQKPRSNPTQLLKVFASFVMAAIRGVAGFW
jgi:hypothetical protein